MTGVQTCALPILLFVDRTELICTIRKRVMAPFCSSPPAVLITTLLSLLAVNEADCDAVLDPAITCFTDVVYPAGE